jgi:hypothetical protein
MLVSLLDSSPDPHGKERSTGVQVASPWRSRDLRTLSYGPLLNGCRFSLPGVVIGRPAVRVRPVCGRHPQHRRWASEFRAAQVMNTFSWCQARYLRAGA